MVEATALLCSGIRSSEKQPGNSAAAAIPTVSWEGRRGDREGGFLPGLAIANISDLRGLRRCGYTKQRSPKAVPEVAGGFSGVKVKFSFHVRISAGLFLCKRIEKEKGLGRERRQKGTGMESFKSPGGREQKQQECF